MLSIRLAVFILTLVANIVLLLFVDNSSEYLGVSKMAKKSKRIRNDHDLPSYLAELKNRLPYNETVEKHVSTTTEAS